MRGQMTSGLIYSLKHFLMVSYPGLPHPTQIQHTAFTAHVHLLSRYVGTTLRSIDSHNEFE